MTDLDDLAARLAARHPDANMYPPDRPHQAVPNRPAPSHPVRAPLSGPPSGALLEAMVERDLDRIDAELEGREPSRVLEMIVRLRQGQQVLRFDLPTVQWFSLDLDNITFKVARNTVLYGPGKPRKPKTFVAPGKRDRGSWMDRVKQSQQARKR